MTATWSCQCLGSRCWLPSGSGADSAWRSPWTRGLWAPNLPGPVLQGGGAGERDLAKDGCIQLSVWHTSRNSRRRLPFSPSLLAPPRPVVSWELSQACPVSSEETGNSGLCPQASRGHCPRHRVWGQPAHHGPGGSFSKASGPGHSVPALPSQRLVFMCFSGLCY